TVQSHHDSSVVVQTVAGALKVDSASSPQTAFEGRRLTLAIRPEKVALNPVDTRTNCLRAQVADLVYNGAETQYLLRSGDQTLRACLMNARTTHPSLRVGDEITAHLPPEGLILLED